ncbi:Isopenicillin N epimerase component 1 [Pseudocercospora fuligena]|uniref:Very long-chain fatty acid transport protein n=1 Tax=Pseudocercospora fuligena TaxID=685502 RepID=A0A8H6VKW6_9PEZI|nr:Isopenicillin N epimerase component 1 [Pseudocercospora fuligena]
MALNLTNHTLATGIAIAGLSAAAAYIDAKYHITKDVATLQEQREVRRTSERRGGTAAKQNKRSAWYTFEEQALLRKEGPCIWYRKEPGDQPTIHSWTDVHQNATQLGRFLLENGVRPGDLVGSYLMNSPDFIVSMLGSWAIGSGLAMMNYNLAGEGLLHCLKVADSKVLLVEDDDGCRDRIEHLRQQIEALNIRIIVLDTATKDNILSEDTKRLGDEYRQKVTPDYPVFIFYTSGTTGFPKACAFPTAAHHVLTFPRMRSTGIRPGDVWYDCMPFYHGTGCTIAIGCMMNGVTLAIGRKFSVRNFWKDVHDSEANAFVYVGETARYLLAAPPSPLDRDHKLKAMYGNGMRPDIWLKFQERFNIPVVNEFFNSTEGMLSLLNVCRGPFHAAHVGHHGAIQRWLLRNKIVPVEIDYERGDTIWRDSKTGFARRKPYEEGGEIIIACETEKDFVGYWNNPDATEKRFERNVFKKGDLYYRTGDALRRDADGRWYFMDRLGDTYRWKSENVSTAEVAEVLGRFPGVVEANVYGVEVPGHDGRAGCAAVFIRPEDRATFDFAGLLAHARKGLPRYAVPIFLRLIQSPTPMHNNKQNKLPLRKEGIDPDKIVTGDAGKDDTLLWATPNSTSYQPFSKNDLSALFGGKVRL